LLEANHGSRVTHDSRGGFLSQRCA
jgi:hypothetical protein